MQPGPLREYDRPPVVETILGVQFQPLPGFSNAHLGAFWKAIGCTTWPTLADAAPLEPQFERFGEDARWIPAGVLMKFSQEYSSRLQMKNEKGDRMVQLQNGRLIFNWLGEAGTGYPGYAAVRAGFVSALEQFVRFIADEKLGSFQPNQWEITYLNHIPQGTVWKSPDDWPFFKPLGGVPTLSRLIQGESFAGGWHFRIPDERGRLHIQWQHARAGETKEVVVLTLTARGPMADEQGQVPAVLDGLDLGRATIVCSFEALMSNDANKFWGLKHAGN